MTMMMMTVMMSGLVEVGVRASDEGSNMVEKDM